MPFSVTQQTQQNKQTLTRILPYLEFVAIVCLGVFILVKGVWCGWTHLGTDFPQYYLGAKLVAEHYSLDRFYDWAWLQRQACHFGIHEVVGFPGLTPFSTLVLLPLAWLSALQAKHAWILLNIAFLIAAIHVLSKESSLSLRRAWLVALLALLPLRNDFALGQMHLIVFALLVLAWRFHIQGKQVASGCCIALAGMLKIYPLFYCFYFVVKKRWRALGTAAATSLACGGISMALFGATATKIFIGRQLPRLLNGEALDPFLASATSATTMFHRLFFFEPEWNPHPLAYSPFLYAALYALWQALPTAAVVAQLRRGFAPDQRETIEWCSFLTLLMFLSSQPETYHFVALIAAAVPTYAILRKVGPRLSFLYLGIYAIVCNARNISSHSWLAPVLTIVLIPQLWAGLTLIIIYVAVLSSPRFLFADPAKMTSNFVSSNQDVRDRRLSVFAAFSLLFPALCLLTFASLFGHLKSMALTHSHSIVEPDGAWMRAKPQATVQGLYYVALLNTGFKILHDGFSVYGGTGEDQLDYAVNREGTTVWIETATNAGPVIAELVGGRVVCDIQNGESPVPSHDGSSLALIREERGRGSLWIADARSCGSLKHPLRITSPKMDVRAVGAMSKGQFVFSAMTKQGPVVFLVSPGRQIEEVLRPGADVESMAVSEDGESIVMSELLNEHWELINESLRTHAVHRITSGECNSTDPFLKDVHSMLYATDCGRSMGLSTVVERDREQ